MESVRRLLAVFLDRITDVGKRVGKLLPYLGYVLLEGMESVRRLLAVFLDRIADVGKRVGKLLLHLGYVLLHLGQGRGFLKAGGKGRADHNCQK
jgi:hypothetical protein